MKRSYPGSDLDREVAAAVDVIYEDLSERRWDALEAHFLPEASLVFSTPKGPTRMSPPKFIEMMQKNLEGKTVFGERMAHAWVRTHGAIKGCGLALGRLCRCQPWGGSGFDPVPAFWSKP